MNTNLIYERIKNLCEEKGITINKLERDLGFGMSSLQKWKKNVTCPSLEKVKIIANYFDVSIDYLSGETDIRKKADDLLADEATVSMQRALQNMTEPDREKAIKIIRIGFGYAFREEN